jgi:hypothetical protein
VLLFVVFLLICSFVLSRCEMVATIKAAGVAKAGGSKMPRKLNLSHGPDVPAVSALETRSPADDSDVEETGNYTASIDRDCNELCPDMATYILKKGAKKSGDRDWNMWLNELHIALHVNGQSRTIAGKGGRRTLAVRWLTLTESSQLRGGTP